MLSVKTCELSLVQALDDREHGGVDEADAGMWIALAQLSDTGVVGRLDVLDGVGAILDVCKERNQNSRI